MNNTIELCVKSLRSSLNEMSIDTFVTDTLEVLMKIEREEYLQNAKNDKGNGFYSRTFSTLTRNSFIVNVPRTRSGAFTPETLQLIKINQQQVDEFCLQLYAIGVTTRDIEDLMKNFFGEEISHSKVSYLAEEFREIREAWKSSSLEQHYHVIYCDCIFITVKRGKRYEKEAVYICYGVREDLKREVLAIEVNPTESAIFWDEVFEVLVKRGVEQVDLVVSDNLSGMHNSIFRRFPNAEHQKCVVHFERNLLKKVRSSAKKELAVDLRHVFDNFERDSSVSKALAKCKWLVDKWSSEYDFSREFDESNMLDFFTYIGFSPEVRRMIYTNNGIENLNKFIRKGTKNKLSFENPARLLDYVFMIVKTFEEKNWMKYPVTGFKHFRHN